MTCAIPEPYRSIHTLPFDDHGWFANQAQLEICLSIKPARLVIEVGCWLGLSTRFIASFLPPGGTVYAVDTWLGSPQESLHMEDDRLSHLYQLFLSNVKHAGLTDKIIPVRMDSLEAADALNVQADLIYLDAAHDTESVYRDILAWYPHLLQDGIFCGDDWNWESVRLAVIKAAGVLKKQIGYYGHFWWLEEKNAGA